MLRLSFHIFLFVSAVVAFTSCSGKKENEKMSKFAYVGAYTPPDGTGKGIYVYEIPPSTDNWSLVETVETGSPSFLCFNRKKDRLYAVNELSGVDGTVSSFKVDPATGKLTFLTAQTTSGTSPCHLKLDKTEKYLVAANYGTGSVVVIEIREDGSVGNQTDLLQHHGSGPNQGRQTGPHAHMVSFIPDVDSPQNLLVVDLGVDQVFQYKFDDQNGKILPDKVASWTTAPGAGPRHSALSKDGKFLYVINELDSTLSVFPYKLENNVKPLQTVSTLPQDWSGESFPAELALHSAGRFLYGSNRGHDSIVIYSIDEDTGLVSLVGHQLTKGKTPRHFEIDHNNNLYVGNQNSNTITVFKIDPKTGQLSDTNQTIEVPSPVCIDIKKL